MAIRKITTPDNPEPPGGIFSKCLVVGDQIFLAGMTAGGKEFMSWDSRGWQTNRSLFRKAQEACKWGVEHDLAEGHSRVFVPRRGWVGWGSCLRQSQKGHETPPLRAPK